LKGDFLRDFNKKSPEESGLFTMAASVLAGGLAQGINPSSTPHQSDTQ
jgi:hypothetical protein